MEIRGKVKQGEHAIFRGVENGVNRVRDAVKGCRMLSCPSPGAGGNMGNKTSVTAVPRA